MMTKRVSQDESEVAATEVPIQEPEVSVAVPEPEDVPELIPVEQVDIFVNGFPATFPEDVPDPVVPIVDIPFPAADWVVDGLEAKEVLTYKRPGPAFQSVAFLGQGIPFYEVPIVAFFAFRAVKPGGVLFTTKKIAAHTQFSNFAQRPVPGFPNFVEIAKPLPEQNE